MPLVSQQKESNMLNRTSKILLLSFIAVAVSVTLLFCTSSTAVADERTFADGVFLGQNNSQKSPTVFDRFKQGWNNFWQDDDKPEPRNDQRATLPAQPAVPIQPPKPQITPAEIQQSLAVPVQGQGQEQGRRTAAPQSRLENSAGHTTSGRDVADDEDEGVSEASTLERMNNLRRTVFANPVFGQAARDSRQMTNTARPAEPRAPTPSPPPSPPPSPSLSPSLSPSSSLSPSLSPQEPWGDQNSISGGVRHFADIPVVNMEMKQENTPEIATNRQSISRNDQREIGVSVPPLAPTATPSQTQTQTQTQTPSQQAVSRIRDLEKQPSEPLAKKTVVGTGPQLDVEITKPPAAMLGQEVTFQILVKNTGNASAEQVVLATEIPSWIDVRQPETDAGKVTVQPRGDNSGISDLSWRITRIDSGATHLLKLRVIPRQHRSIELHFSRSFQQPTIGVSVGVQEPKLEMELLGPDEVLWDADVVYTLLVRNPGTGNAENLKLTLLQTNSDAAQCEFEEPLAPGEEQPIAISVRAGKEQEYIDIAVQASGAHDLRGEIKRRVRVLRPKLNMTVQTLALHFVDNPAECMIRVTNVGNADAENITIRAELPLGAQYDSSSEGGSFATQQQQNVVEWRRQSIAKGETLTYLLTCLPKREGECRITVEAIEANGGIMVAGNSVFTAEAVTELDLVVHRPRGHVEQGQETEYTIEITNVGTKAAENVEISMAFGWKRGDEHAEVVVLEPIDVVGHDAKMDNNGMVVFDKIPAILPKQRVELKVIAKAEQTGTVQVKTHVSGKDIPGLGNELSTTVTSRRGGTAATAGGPNEFR